MDFLLLRLFGAPQASTLQNTDIRNAPESHPSCSVHRTSEGWGTEGVSVLRAVAVSVLLAATVYSAFFLASGFPPVKHVWLNFWRAGEGGGGSCEIGPGLSYC